MHELAITQGILDVAVSEAAKHSNSKITKISIKCGVLSGLVPDCIQEYYDLLSEDTLAAGASLEFDIVPATIHCDECSSDSKIDRFRLRCPICNSPKVTVTSGRDLYIDSMEIEED